MNCFVSLEFSRVLLLRWWWLVLLLVWEPCCCEGFSSLTPPPPSSSNSPPKLPQGNQGPDVLCMGEVLMEFVARNEPNTPLTRVSKWNGDIGGAPANMAVAIQRLGEYQASFIGCVGRTDAFGDKINELLQQDGVDTSYLFRSELAPTTLVFGAVWDDGRKDMCFYRGADREIPVECITDQMFAGKRCFHYGSIGLIDSPGSEAQKLATKRAREQGLMVTYDPNYRPTLWPNEKTAKRVIRNAFQYAHMVKISEEEFEIATGCEDMEDGFQAILDQGVELVLVSKGEGGSLASNGKFTVESPALEGLNIVETTGAGDAFFAAMITKLLPEFEKQNGSLKDVDKQVVQDALDYANVVAGLACTKSGAIPALPTKAEVEAIVSKRQEIFDFAAMLDYALLQPNMTENGDIEKLCEEARHFKFGLVAVNPAVVKECSELLKGSGVKVGAAIGYPFGSSTTAVKAFEAKDAIANGASEIDMVINIRDLQSGRYGIVREEIESVQQVCRIASSDVVLKVILETCYLTKAQKIAACEICRDVGVDFVKTSTGMGPGGATVEDIKLMRQTLGDDIGIKASGGIRNLAAVTEMVRSGATRIGTSHAVRIMEEMLNSTDFMGGLSRTTKVDHEDTSPIPRIPQTQPQQQTFASSPRPVISGYSREDPNDSPLPSRVSREIYHAPQNRKAPESDPAAVSGAAFVMPQRQRSDSTSQTRNIPLESRSIGGDSQKLASTIDYTIRSSYLADDAIERHCKKAMEYGFATVAVFPPLVAKCSRLLKDSKVGVTANIGFSFEVQDVIAAGATEIDMVLNIRDLKGKLFDLVRSEIDIVLKACRAHKPPILCKVTLETDVLTDNEKMSACQICLNAGVDFVKTSTGMDSAGATAEDVKLMRQVVGTNMGVKASGDIRDLPTVQKLIKAGASRIGTSHAVSIMEELSRKSN